MFEALCPGQIRVLIFSKIAKEYWGKGLATGSLEWGDLFLRIRSPASLLNEASCSWFQILCGTWEMLKWKAWETLLPPRPTWSLKLLRSWDSTGGETETQTDKVTKWQSQNLTPGLHDLKAHTPSAPTKLDPGRGKWPGRQREGNFSQRNVPSESHSAFPPKQLQGKNRVGWN